MQAVIETPEFFAWAKTVLSDDERLEFIDWIAENPLAGEVIPGATPLRKVRWSRAGTGKRGGARVIYFLRRPGGEVVLILVYAKAKFDQLSDKLLLKLKEKFDASKR